MHGARKRAVSIAGFLLTDEEWQDYELRLALLAAWAEKTTASYDRESYDQFEVTVEPRGSELGGDVVALVDHDVAQILDGALPLAQ